MNVTCTRCEAVYRVDPRKVPAGGVLARCSHCSGTFRVEVEQEEALPLIPSDGRAAPEEELAAVTAEPSAAEGAEATRQGGERAAGDAGFAAPTEEAAAPPEEEREATTLPAPRATTDASGGGEARPPSPFGSADPHARARRLARALVSDIVVYHPERRERARQTGTLRQEFREEIKKSWEEYVGQVGAEFGRQTPYFRDALNEILAGGDRVF